MSKNAAEREAFRNERLNKISTGKSITVLPLDETPRIILHMIPHTPLETFDLGAFTLPTLQLENEIDHITPEVALFLPITAPYNRRVGGKFNDDGLLVYVRAAYDIRDGNPVMEIEPEKRSAYSYLQVFNDGSIEVVRASYYRGHRLIHENYETALLEAVPRCLRIQEELGVEPPISVYLTLSGVLNAHLSDDSKKEKSGPLKTDPFYIPEIVVASFAIDDQNKLIESLREGFQQVRHAAGRY